MLSQKAQEAAPFQLLVVVVMLGFVLVMGLFVLTHSNEQQCGEQAKKVLERTRQDLESLIKQDEIKRITIDVPQCGEGKKELSMRLEQNREVCSLYCIGANERCVLLVFSSETISQATCLRVPPTTQFLGVTECGNPERRPKSIPLDFELFPVDFAKTSGGQTENDLNAGEYFFTQKTNPQSGVPEVCAYKLQTGT
ncbi:MAG: hypothetical protein HY392_01660 [Candidatus Diapherotrites archaeon]|nr:hypothetical protein [Candidatus Diapherotrites archaeon]